MPLELRTFWLENITMKPRQFLFLLFLVQQILSGCATSSNKGPRGNPLAQAARLGNIEELKKISQQQNMTYDDVDDNGVSALMIASRFGQVETVRFLLENGANVDRQDRDQQSALEYALLGNAEEDQKKSTLQLLLTKGANPFRPNAFGLIPVFEMASEGYLEALKTLNYAEQRACDRVLVNKYEDTIVNLAKQRNHMDVARFLESQGCR